MFFFTFVTVHGSLDYTQPFTMLSSESGSTSTLLLIPVPAIIPRSQSSTKYTKKEQKVADTLSDVKLHYSKETHERNSLEQLLKINTT